jgi:hypothetical protein
MQCSLPASRRFHASVRCARDNSQQPHSGGTTSAPMPAFESVPVAYGAWRMRQASVDISVRHEKSGRDPSQGHQPFRVREPEMTRTGPDLFLVLQSLPMSVRRKCGVPSTSIARTGILCAFCLGIAFRLGCASLPEVCFSCPVFGPPDCGAPSARSALARLTTIHTHPNTNPLTPIAGYSSLRLVAMVSATDVAIWAACRQWSSCEARFLAPFPERQWFRANAAFSGLPPHHQN